MGPPDGFGNPLDQGIHRLLEVTKVGHVEENILQVQEFVKDNIVQVRGTNENV